jgi:adenylyltransferase/sulfurtransferase
MRAKSGVLVGTLAFVLAWNVACGQKDTSESKKLFGELTAAEVKKRLAKGDSLVILDVRTKEEYESETGHLPGAVLIPVQELENRYHELDSLKSREIVAYCRTGRRSERASKLLGEKGFKAYNLLGGILEWNKGKGDSLKVK